MDNHTVSGKTVVAARVRGAPANCRLGFGLMMGLDQLAP